MEDQRSTLDGFFIEALLERFASGGLGEPVNGHGQKAQHDRRESRPHQILEARAFQDFVRLAGTHRVRDTDGETPAPAAPGAEQKDSPQQHSRHDDDERED